MFSRIAKGGLAAFPHRPNRASSSVQLAVNERVKKTDTFVVRPTRLFSRRERPDPPDRRAGKNGRTLLPASQLVKKS